MYIDESKFVIIKESKTIHFVLPRDADNNLKHYDIIIKRNEFEAEHTTRLAYCYPNISMVTIMHTENRKTNESYKFFLNLKQILDVKNSDKHVPVQNLSIYYT